MLTLKFKDISMAANYGITVGNMLSGFSNAIGNSGTVSYNEKTDTLFVQIGAPCTNFKDNICLPVELTNEDNVNIVKALKEKK